MNPQGRKPRVHPANLVAAGNTPAPNHTACKCRWHRRNQPLCSEACRTRQSRCNTRCNNQRNQRPTRNTERTRLRS
jgi:hypothetical protein